MSLKNALMNLEELAAMLEVQSPTLDENFACCLEGSDGLSLHFMYDEQTDHLFVYLPLLQSLPKDAEGKSSLYEMLLECSLQFARIESGRIGIDTNSDLLMFFDRIDMKDSNKEKLIALLPEFMNMGMLWKEIIGLRDRANSNNNEPLELSSSKGMKI